MKVKCNSCNALCINGIPCHETSCYDNFIFTKNGREYIQFEIQSLDVWGNKKDGFEINACYNTGRTILVKLDFNDSDLVKALKKEGTLYKLAKNKMYSYDDVNLRYKDEPIIGLKKL